MRKWQHYQSAQFSGICLIPEQRFHKALILLHGVGANEQSLLSVAEYLAPEQLLICLRAPLVFGTASFGWFQVQFTEQGPVHNWPQAQHSLQLLQQEISAIAEAYQLPLSDISLCGFSQGAIMTMGLAIQGSQSLDNYICLSGRTLQELASMVKTQPQQLDNRKILLAHGVQDNKLTVEFARQAKALLQPTGARLHYLEFDGGHEIQHAELAEVKQWLAY